MSVLDQIQSPADLRALPLDSLPGLAKEIRDRIIEIVGKNGGHLTSNLGVTELTIALHRVFDFAHDRLLWDVGHQCYPHKLLTGRNKRFDTLRKAGGISGFPNTAECECDLFNVGHAGTAVATAVGMARADQILKKDRNVVALVGDASIVNGVSLEGLNQAGTLRRQFLVVLNDNEWGISPTQGGMAEFLAKFRASDFYDEVKARTKELLPKLPVFGKPAFEMIAHLKEGIKATVSPGQVFEPLGLQYVGPVDGHDIKHMIDVLERLKPTQHPVLLHVHTVKGNGCAWAIAEPGKFHSPKPFVIEGGKVTIKSGKGKSWTSAFVEALIQLAEKNDKIHALTAGMLDGTGLNKFQERFPERCRDVGITESCTVDQAAGMCKAGLRPVAAIYSTFLQRAFDQVFQEVSLQGLPVMFCIDRAGLVGSDGSVHHGFLDIAYLRGLPGMVLMAPIDEVELQEALKFGFDLDGPCTIRYPRDSVPAPMPDCPPFELGKSRRLRDGDTATVLCYGVTATHAMAAADLLAESGTEVSVINARFARPIDREMVSNALADGKPAVTVEDHSVAGGFGSAVLETAQEMGLDASRVVRLGMPADRFIAHGSRAGQMAECGYDATGIASTIQRLVGAVERADQLSSTQERSTSIPHKVILDPPPSTKTQV
ncbi:MAG: 1-deoxy-D-xylulose-5-phosphate synthase [Phycisphaerales bacterium]|nr:MAG: 1-deoxy-D-xylulose-5-phosphate synthase [Phycisphaerales bacterium]